MRFLFLFFLLVWNSQRRKQEAIDLVASDSSSPVAPTRAEQGISICCAHPATPALNLNFFQTLFEMKMQQFGLNEH